MGNKTNKGIKKHEPEIQEIIDPKEIENGTVLREKRGHKETRHLSVERQRFSGPLPPPEVLSGYEKILPGAADRILCMAENQAEHRQEMEKTFLKANSRNSFVGLIFAFIIAIAIAIGGLVCIIMGKGFSGTFLGAAGLAGIIGIFIHETKLTRGTNKNIDKNNTHTKEKIEGEEQ